MLGEGMVSFGTAVVTVSRRNVKSSAKIVSSSRILPWTRMAAGVNSMSPGSFSELDREVLVGGLADAAEAGR